MAFSIGSLPWCDAEQNLASSCFQRSVIYLINLLFLCIFFLLSAASCVSKQFTVRSRNKGWTFVAAAICCLVTSITFLGAGLKLLTDDSNDVFWVAYFVQGTICVSLAVSLFFSGSKWISIVTSLWWVSFALLDSAEKIEILSQGKGIRVLDIITLPMSLMLLLCFYTSLKASPAPQDCLSDPLVTDKPIKHSARLASAGFFSVLTFSWMNPLLLAGSKKPLSPEDIPSLVPEDEAELAYIKFSQAWDTLLAEGSSSKERNLVFRAIAKVYFKENIFTAVCALFRTIAVVSLPLMLYVFVNYANSDHRDLRTGFFNLACLVLLKLIDSLSMRHWYFAARRSGMRIRSGLMVAAYKKQLKLSSLGRKKHSSGEIVNYIAVDAYRMGEFLWWFHSGWSLTLQLLLSTLVLFGVVGAGAFPGLILLFLCGLLNLPFAKMLKNSQTQFMMAQDKRLRSTSETLNSMKVIKLQSWEEEFKSQIESFRADEFRWLAKAQMTKAFGTFLYWMSPTIVSAVIFVACGLLKSAPLNASTIFTVLATLRVMSEPVRLIPEAISAIIQVNVSFDRINNFLLGDELKIDEIERSGLEESGNVVVDIQAGNFSWDPEMIKIPTLTYINLDIKYGQTVAVCGPVGAGKSSLLHALLGEIPKVSGTVKVCGSIAYVSQTSWIQSGTIRDNILYGKPMEARRYNAAIEACALDKDLSDFRHGDLTEIGQRGLNLSGGQKQRIQLARAVYADADVYLLDDPFSAVDAHTAGVLFHKCVEDSLKEKTVILVTHQVEFLSEVDQILVMEEGSITQSGKYEELLKMGTAFQQLVNAHNESMGDLRQVGINREMGDIDVDKVKEETTTMEDIRGIQLTQEEEKESGYVGLKPFLDYFRVSQGWFLLSATVLGQVGFVVFQAASTYWLAFAIGIPKLSTTMVIGVYSIISTLSAGFVYSRAVTTAYLGLKASKAFFSGFTNAVFKAPMLFFDSTPVGRILTRASSDMNILDFDIPSAFILVVVPAIELTAALIIMTYVTWQVIIIALLALAATKVVQDYYLASARELIRINGTTKAPVMNYAAETSLGVVTIRAFGTVDRFFRSYLNLVDADAALFFLSNAAMEWVIMRIEILQNMTLFTCALLLILIPKGYIAPGLVGLSLSYALTLTQTQVFLTRWYCTLSNSIISVERIKQYMNIPEEPPAVVDGRRPPSSWPSNGTIHLQELKIRYRPNAPLVLKGISCTFREGTRVGVVGRTGSGKSTLISALFRLVEPASGCILIDGIDISKIGLKDLRMKLSIIPQEPTLFRGCIRTNLDPLGVYSDDEIWKALEKCQLKTTISNLPNKLDSSVSEEGENWSVGQRQLFCLGRVLLKRNKILVLDEATASIDSATDAIIQKTIREEFAECTVITVAHRVPTVIDSDMVMVLSFGDLVEYSEPWKLMETDSYFSKLVAEYWASCRGYSSQNLQVHI
ncbi:ABC transporter C family member 8 [Raphanus sativus]|uniref:ABC-type xenobiotic transporter n=1 Tax=Raphanus sativus TaxID=3726 RepID=A0A6J0LI55_RAPSA|nr:ABC transporter C family member 8-like isoform X1 [Raphanus sativus]KAJ4887060.1 ABC transporter C family member 8 [Raphanus sativus]